MALAILRPNGAGSFAQWTAGPGAGANWQRAGDASDATWNETLVASARDSFAVADLPADAGAVVSVDVHLRAKQVSAGGQDTLRPVLRLAGTDSLGTAYGPGDSFGTRIQTAFPRPGGGAWTAADVDAVEAGYQAVTTGVTGLAAADVWLEVSHTPPTPQMADVLVARTQAADVEAMRIQAADVAASRVQAADVEVSRTQAADASVSRTQAADVTLESA